MDNFIFFIKALLSLLFVGVLLLVALYVLHKRKQEMHNNNPQIQRLNEDLLPAKIQVVDRKEEQYEEDTSESSTSISTQDKESSPKDSTKTLKKRWLLGEIFRRDY